jgi:hypothetical protein
MFKDGRENKTLVIVIDNDAIPATKASQAALKTRPYLTLEWLPTDAPELNGIEHRAGAPSNVKGTTSSDRRCWLVRFV